MPFVIGEVEVTNEVTLAPSAVLYDGAVVADGDLTVLVNNFFYDLGGTKGKYAGSVGNAVTDNAINYVYLDSGAALVINTTGYPASGVYIRLARIAASGGFIVRVLLERAFFTAGGASGVVPVSRNLTAGAGLTGGGDLSADRTFTVGANADGSITVNADDIQVGILASDTQHGSRGGGSQHAVAVAGVSNGFLSSTDKTKIDGYPSTVPDAVLEFAAAGVGTSITARYLAPGYTPNNGPITSMAIRASRAGTLKNLRVRHNSVGVGGTITYTVRINGSDSTLTCSPLASSTGGTDTTHTPSVAADDLLEVRVTKGGSIATSPQDITATIEFNG